MTECIICGMIFNPEKRHSDVCPYCGWIDGFDYDNEDDVPNEANHNITRKQAKALLAQGKDIFGDPLEKRTPDDTEEN